MQSSATTSFVVAAETQAAAWPGGGAGAGKGLQEEVQHVAPYELRLSNAVKCVKNV